MCSKSLPEVPKVPMEEKFTWMTGYFSCDTAMALSKLEEMGVEMEKFIDELSELWPPDMWKFKEPQEAIMFVLNTFGNFYGAEAKFLKVTEEEAVGEVKCAVPYFTEVRPQNRGFVLDLSKRTENIWCQYWCKFWFKNAAAKQGWKFDIEHKNGKCIWIASRLENPEESK